MEEKRKNIDCFSKLDESQAKESDDIDSRKELDCPDISGFKWSWICNGVEYSARVMDKQEILKHESYTSLKAGMKHVSADDCSSEHRQLNISSSTGLSFVPSESVVCSSGPAVLDETLWRRRTFWSQDDKQLFFDALNDFGKNFDAIQNQLASKLRSKNKLGSTSNFVGVNQFIPNKVQVRHFYYKTWKRISKYLTFPKDMKKEHKELYGLVNFGELSKKKTVLNLRAKGELSELVEKGTCNIKVRGKTVLIKTPVCTALNGLNQLYEVEHARVPCELTLELIPKDGTARAAVQRVSHNPRVKVYVPLQRTLASVISYFEERWKTSSDNLNEEFLHTIQRRTVPRLRLIPTDKRDMSVPIFKISEITSSEQFFLRSFTEKVFKESDKTTDVFIKNEKRQGAYNPEDLISETQQKYCSHDIVQSSEDNLTFTTKESSNSDICSCPPSAEGVEYFLSHVYDEETARRGWTVDEAGTLTCGELYLMLGQGDKLCFEYYWDKDENCSPNLIL